ncbi:MAG: hypothetical protein IT533_05095 [Hyphomicrobiales bacterium]|jgi:ElaB/YqjD/DUF883 family membrane-anchored ribosome-binding protein|nr:hypothetical protein [Hyphomicrobiales bacterium]
MSKTSKTQKSSAPDTAAGRRKPSTRKASTRAHKSTAARASSFAFQATDSVLQAASEGASSITHRVHGMLDEQVDRGAAMMSQVASSTRLAADDMSETLPHVAGLVGSMADRIDAFAEEVRDKTVDQVVGIAADFTRRQPLVTFGLAALAGFVVMRALGNSSVSTPPARPAAKKRRSRNG